MQHITRNNFEITHWYTESIDHFVTDTYIIGHKTPRTPPMRVTNSTQ